MLLSVILGLLLLSPAPVVQDTLKAATISSTAGSLIVPQRITSRELESASGLTEAIRRFAGVQVRDYGGIGGLKTVNVRSLGSEHTGVFIDGIQVDNAQNMQVDLGRFGTDDIRGVSLFSGQKVSPLQSAKEYSSASSLYLESAAPVFREGSRNNHIVSLGVGSFGTWTPRYSWEHLFKGGTMMRIGGEAVSTEGKYRFHVKDYRTYPDETIAGYDTTMVRQNGDLRSVRLDARLYSPFSAEGLWNIHAHFYDSVRGLPGPVYKRAGDYPLSQDRQNDMDAFLQGRYSRSLGRIWSVSGRAKYSFSHLEYVDFPELRPELSSAHFNYRNHSAYISGSAMARLGTRFRLNLAQDFQYDYLDADLMDFAFPGRFSSWSCVSGVYSSGPFEVSGTALFLEVRDFFLSGGERHQARRDVVMPSIVARWKPSDKFSLNGFAKRSYRMPTFNDLYYTTVGSKTLDPEDALQFDLGAVWTPVASGRHSLNLRADIYRNYLKNKIIAVSTSNQFRWSMYNLGKVAVLGSDVTADYACKVGKGSFGTVLRYTFQQSLDKTPSTLRQAQDGAGSGTVDIKWNGQIPYIPLHSGSANLFGELSGWRADVTMFVTGERFTTSANLPAYRLAPWTILDASLAKSLSLKNGELNLKLCLNNILDEQYEIIDNYPMPGINLILKVEYSF
ncbi:MAG: TonB-dependent receptor [Bacteroidales bacterium]|nr:TonB-dependent receptor [Bacteroidales bacterium]